MGKNIKSKTKSEYIAIDREIIDKIIEVIKEDTTLETKIIELIKTSNTLETTRYENIKLMYKIVREDIRGINSILLRTNEFNKKVEKIFEGYMEKHTMPELLAEMVIELDKHQKKPDINAAEVQ